MSRVEPKNRPTPAPREAEPGRGPRKQPAAPTPDKAEGDERTVDKVAPKGAAAGDRYPNMALVNR